MDEKYVSKEAFRNSCNTLIEHINANTKAISEIKNDLNYKENGNQDLYNRLIYCEQNYQILKKELSQLKYYVDNFAKDTLGRFAQIDNEIDGLKNPVHQYGKSRFSIGSIYEGNTNSPNNGIINSGGNDSVIDRNSSNYSSPKKNSTSSNKLNFLEDYYSMSSREFISRYGVKEFSLSNFSELRTGISNTPEFREDAGGYIMFTISKYDYLLPEKSFFENPNNRLVINTVFDVDADLKNTALQSRNIKSPSILKQKDAKAWTCIEKGKIKA